MKVDKHSVTFDSLEEAASSLDKAGFMLLELASSKHLKIHSVLPKVVPADYPNTKGTKHPMSVASLYNGTYMTYCNGKERKVIEQQNILMRFYKQD